MKYLPLLTFFLLPTLALAQGYSPIVGIPGVNPNANFDSYINAIYALSISIAALLAVIKIVIAGVKWMMTDVVTSKGEAKKDIQGALIGLLIVLGAVLILTVINPNLTKVNLKFNPISQTILPTTAPAATTCGPANPVLKTGAITTLNIAPGTVAKVDYISVGSVPTCEYQQQQQLLLSACVPGYGSYSPSLYGLRPTSLSNGAARCLIQPNGYTVALMIKSQCDVLKNTMQPGTNTPVNSFVKWYPDPESVGDGYCTWKP